MTVYHLILKKFKKLNSLITKNDIFYQIEFILQVMMDLKTNLFTNQHLIHQNRKKNKGADYALRWKSNGVYNSKLKTRYTAFSHNMKLSRYRTGIKFDEDPLAREQNNYGTKIVKVYIVYRVNAWPRNPTNNFKFKNCLFGATSIVKIVIKKSISIVDMEKHLIVQVCRALKMTLLEMLKLLVLMIVHHLIRTIAKIIS